MHQSERIAAKLRDNLIKSGRDIRHSPLAKGCLLLGGDGRKFPPAHECLECQDGNLQKNVALQTIFAVVLAAVVRIRTFFKWSQKV